MEGLTPNFDKTYDGVPQIATSLAPDEMIHSIFICEHLTEIVFKTLRRQIPDQALPQREIR